MNISSHKISPKIIILDRNSSGAKCTPSFLFNTAFCNWAIYFWKGIFLELNAPPILIFYTPFCNWVMEWHLISLSPSHNQNPNPKFSFSLTLTRTAATNVLHARSHHLHSRVAGTTLAAPTRTSSNQPPQFTEPRRRQPQATISAAPRLLCIVTLPKICHCSPIRVPRDSHATLLQLTSSRHATPPSSPFRSRSNTYVVSAATTIIPLPSRNHSRTCTFSNATTIVVQHFRSVVHIEQPRTSVFSSTRCQKSLVTVRSATIAAIVKHGRSTWETLILERETTLTRGSLSMDCQRVKTGQPVNSGQRRVNVGQTVY